MRRSLRNHLAALLATAGVAACAREDVPDAYGNFEATEVVVSAQASGQLLAFGAREGDVLAAGAVVGQVDTAQVALEREQLAAQREAAGSRTSEVARQVEVLRVQRDIARRALERTRRLHAAQAATAHQLDQAERDYRVLEAQIAAAEAQRRTVGQDASAAAARLAQIRDRLARTRIVNPRRGTVIATYARAGEVVQAGQPLYRIADLDTLELRAWVDESQLASVPLGGTVSVRIDDGDSLRTLPGVVTWVSPKAEFTPTPVQTRDERADLVYAIKVRVANRGGILKIGMPADVSFPGGDAR